MGRVRPSVPRSRLPLHRHLLADPGALRRWLLVAALALATGALTSRLVGAATAARDRWGRTAPVLVVEREVDAGGLLAGAVREARWPVALAPDHAVRPGRLPRDARAAAPLSPGTPLTDPAVAAGARRAQGHRVPVPAATAASHLEPGDRVDVWATVDPSLSGGPVRTRAVARGAVVAANAGDVVVVAVGREEVDEVVAAVALATVTLVAVG